MSVTPVKSPLYLRCPTCGAQPGESCVTKLGHSTDFHKARPNTAKVPDIPGPEAGSP
jgi:hypothetical protein